MTKMEIPIARLVVLILFLLTLFVTYNKEVKEETLEIHYSYRVVCRQGLVYNIERNNRVPVQVFDNINGQIAPRTCGKR